MLIVFRAGFAFSAYSYGRQENLKRYGTEEPPEYDLSLVTVPVIVFWSANDYVVGPEVIYPFPFLINLGTSHEISCLS